MGSFDVPDDVEEKVRDGIADSSPDPARIGVVKEIREATTEEAEKFGAPVDSLWYYKVRAGDMDMGYDKIYYGFVERKNGRLIKHKQGSFDN